MTNNIVNVNVAQVVGSSPSTLQQTGAFVSQGGTTKAANSVTLITQVADLTAILTPTNAITSITWASNIVTVTTAAPHNIPTGQIVQGVIAGVSPVGYDGTFQCTSTGAETLTYPLGTNPGSETALGTFQIGSAVQLTAMANTFFAQGSNLACYVLELGTNGTAVGVTELQAYINAPTLQIYNYLLPSTWDVESTAPTMCRNFTGTTAQVYFTVSTTISTYTNWSGIKSVFALLPSPTAPVTEFSAADAFYNMLFTNPSAASLMLPLLYQYVSGVTPYVLTNAQVTTLKAAFMNWIGTGAQGGISNTLIMGGQYADGNVWSYWYGVDYMSINLQQQLSAAVINGSNTPQNPLYYNQAGINALEKVINNFCTNSAVAFGVILTGYTSTAVTFAAYIASNPSDYTAGIYRGFAVTFTPRKGFTSITINLTASQIPTGS